MSRSVGRLLSAVFECTDPDRPQQAHIDVLVDDLDTADARVGALGGQRLTDDVVVHEDESFRVYADLDGHPFCLINRSPPICEARDPRESIARRPAGCARGDIYEARRAACRTLRR